MITFAQRLPKRKLKQCSKTSAYGYQTNLSLFLIFLKRRWIKMQYYIDK
jgi:hypothetical protein